MSSPMYRLACIEVGAKMPERTTLICRTPARLCTVKSTELPISAIFHRAEDPTGHALRSRRILPADRCTNRVTQSVTLPPLAVFMHLSGLAHRSFHAPVLIRFLNNGLAVFSLFKSTRFKTAAETTTVSEPSSPGMYAAGQFLCARHS